MDIRKLNQKGITYAQNILDNYNDMSSEQINRILISEEYSVKIVPAISIEERIFETRFDAAKYLYEKLEKSSIENIPQDIGLWTWLALFYRDSLVKGTSSEQKKPGASARWLLEPYNHQRYYRHLLAGPYIIFKAYRDEVESAMILLFQKLHTPGEIVEQIVSRQELIQNRAFLKTATRLYYDPCNKSLKRGASSKVGGSPRRLSDIFNQFELTRDMFALDANEILTLLPTEFDKFKKI